MKILSIVILIFVLAFYPLRCLRTIVISNNEVHSTKTGWDILSALLVNIIQNVTHLFPLFYSGQGLIASRCPCPVVRQRPPSIAGPSYQSLQHFIVKSQLRWPRHVLKTTKDRFPLSTDNSECYPKGNTTCRPPRTKLGEKNQGCSQRGWVCYKTTGDNIFFLRSDECSPPDINNK